MLTQETPKKKIRIRCPECKSTNINQYRMPTGPIWCGDCGHRVEHKESDKSFYEEIDE